MPQHILKKRYDNFLGLDLKSNYLLKSEQYATGMLNTQYRKDAGIEKRKGYKAYAGSKGGFGLFDYGRINPDSGASEPELLSVSSKLHKLKEAQVNVAYSGALLNLYLSIYYDTNTSNFRCVIDDGVTTYLNQALGVGFDELSTYTLSNLVTALNSVTGITATLTGDGSISAALALLVREHDLVVDGAYVIKAGYWSDVNCPVASPFAGSETNKASSSFENVTATQLNNVIYLSNGYDEVQKYDGQNIYRAGLPTPTAPTATAVAGAITGTNYRWLITYKQIDAVGNVTEGNYVTTASNLNLTAQNGSLSLPNIIASTGFNTNAAIVNGAQAAVNTITVDNGAGGAHTLKVGDKAYFYDAISASYVTRDISAISGTSITVSGAAVTVADNAVISNNLKIVIYRSFSSGSTPTDYWLVAEVPNDSFNANQTYIDSTLDVNLGAQYIYPATLRDAPPKGKYITQYHNLLVVAGNPTLQNTVFFSDVDSPEYFPLDSNSFDIETVNGEVITGISQDNEVLAIFKQRSTTVVNGTLTDSNFRVNLVSNDIGCVAHATIQELSGALVWLSERGPYVMVSGQIPKALGNGLIEPGFDYRGLSQSLTPNLKKAIGFNDRKQLQYWMYIPCERTVSGDKEMTSDSYLYVFDYYRGSFLYWNAMNCAGGIALHSNNVYFSERRYSDFSSSVEHVLYVKSNLNDAWDYEDHATPITSKYYGNWESMGEPSVLKRFIRVKVFADQATPYSMANLSVKSEINYTSPDTKADFTMDFDDVGYGVSAYGAYPWGDVRNFEMKHTLNSGRVRSLRVVFNNAEHQTNMEILGWELEIAMPFKPGLKG